MVQFTDFIKKVFTFQYKKRPKEAEQHVDQRKEGVVCSLRPYMGTLQDIVLWQNTNLTIYCIISLNLFLWIIRFLGFRPFGVVFGLVLLFLVLDYFGIGKNTSSNNGEQLVHAFVRARQWLSNAYADMLQLRQENPSKFGLVLFAELCVVWIIIRMGATLFIHVVANSMFLAPLVINIKTTDSAKGHADSDGEVEEFLPELSSHAIEELNRAGEVQETNELVSLSSDLALPSDSSILFAAAEGKESSDDENDTFLETNKNPNKSHSSTPSIHLTESSDSDSEFIPKDTRMKNLHTEHFQKESEKDIDTFRSVKDVSKVMTANINKDNPSTSAWIPFIVNAAGSYLKYPWSMSAKKDHDSDSDEFELVEKSDL